MRELPDQAARRRIQEALDVNLLVEAGAGSGKTTALIDRMLGLVRRGDPVEGLAAVTFTRKAAGELRERFQERLEDALRHTPGNDPARPRLEAALRSMDRGFMGTIHAFCARLLRERPLEAGLDPAFTELTAARERVLALEWWEEWLERMASEGDPALDTLAELGLEPSQLHATFLALNESLDVDYPTPSAPPPDPEAVQALRRELEGFMEEAEGLMPEVEPVAGWGPAQLALRTAWFTRRRMEWEDPLVLLPVLERIPRAAEKLTMSRWEEDRSAQGPIKDFRDRLREWSGEGSRLHRVLEAWFTHRYPHALSFALRAAREFGDFRKRTGQLSFHDLLRITAQLLRSSVEARRDLGNRYTQLLVDEFQDTDPLQAEILFLLTSDPSEEATSWLEADPLPGSLFVVGDPKQSIYRFRRADIALYQQVRTRFEWMGEVVRLTANFRSTPPVAGLVNHVFQDPERLPGEATTYQAPFAPLEPHRAREARAAGVWSLDLPDDPESNRGTRPEHEAAVLARWVAERVSAGERVPGDFLVLARTKRNLGEYARALEAWGLPVEVTGARAGIQDELQELRILLEALADPGDPVKTVAALTGIFLGVDLEELLIHREEGGSFDLRHAGGSADGSAAEALATLRRWWRRARCVPADVIIPEMVAEAGLLPLVVGGELGGVRGGALAFALDLVRSACLEGDTSLEGALNAIATGVEDEEWEAPLEPGRSDAVRVMNLHKAKGLEAPVVVLVDPDRSFIPPTRSLVARGEDGEAKGWLEVGIPGNYFGQFDLLAHPPGWAALQAEADRFDQAEEIRLLYVAATRAEDELVVVRNRHRKNEKSPWDLFHDWLDREGEAVEGILEEAPPRPPLPVTAEEVGRTGEGARSRRSASGEVGFRFLSVTALVKGVEEAPAPDAGGPPDEHGPPLGDDLPLEPVYLLDEGDSSGPGGTEWGSAVHVTLEAAARGLDGPGLRAAARAALLERDRPVRGGEPTELPLLLAVVEEVLRSPLWARAQAAPVRLSEYPFLVHRREEGLYLEGVVDLAFREADGWVLVDYKTDRDDRAFGERLPRYEAQLREYGRAWEVLTGESVKERHVFRVGAGKRDPKG